jgi:hypothetical protein
MFCAMIHAVEPQPRPTARRMSAPAVRPPGLPQARDARVLEVLPHVIGRTAQRIGFICLGTQERNHRLGCRDKVAGVEGGQGGFQEGFHRSFLQGGVV